jgi:hypothetical protein
MVRPHGRLWRPGAAISDNRPMPERRLRVYRRVLDIDPDTEANRARLAFESHLSRARWMTKQGYRHLLRSGDA